MIGLYLPNTRSIDVCLKNICITTMVFYFILGFMEVNDKNSMYFLSCLSLKDMCYYFINSIFMLS